MCSQSQNGGSDPWGGPDPLPYTPSLKAPFPKATRPPGGPFPPALPRREVPLSCPLAAPNWAYCGGGWHSGHLDLRLCLWEGGWAEEQPPLFLFTQVCLQAARQVGPLCCPPAACWLMHCLSSLPADPPPILACNQPWDLELHQEGLALGGHERCLTRDWGCTMHPMGV